MLKVKNNKCISRLADKSFRANKTRNIIAVIAIALTTILFTALFTIGSGAVEYHASGRGDGPWSHQICTAVHL